MQENIRKYFLNAHILLTAILLLGFIIRIWGLGSAEIFHDEGLYAFRSIGYIDYIQNDDQSTPIQWFRDLPTMPWWTKLSFHDHPPLFFLVQHLFFRVFGNSLFVARLPSLIAGMFAIWLMYLIGRQLSSTLEIRTNEGYLNPESASEPAKRNSEMVSRRGDEKIIIFRAGKDAREANNPRLFGLFAALLLSVNHIHIWISRTSIIESLLLTMMLANIYFFLRFVEDKKWWFLFAITLGLSFLTKYNSIVLVPVYAVYLILYHRSYFRAKELYFAIGATIILFSPVLMYNYYLYTTVHHFDLQMAYFFKQATPEWRASLGKIQEPFSVFIPNMLAMYSKPFLLVAIAGIFSILFFWRKESKGQKKSYLFLFFGVVFVTLLFIKIGVAYRFLTLYLPFFVMPVALFFVFLKQHIRLNKVLFFAAITAFVIWEIWFSIGGIFLEFPHLGVVELDQYLAKEIGSARSSALVKSPNPHLNAVIQRYYNKLPKGDAPVLIVYDENIVISPKLWLFARRLYYGGIPTITVGQFNGLIAKNGVEYFKSYKVYFVKANENSVMINTNLFYSADATNLEAFLKKEFNLNPVKTIYGFQPDNNGLQQIPMFYVYKILF